MLDVASGTVTTLANDRGTDPLAGIAFSPEGERILFSRADALWSVKTDGSDAWLMVSGISWGDWQWQQASPRCDRSREDAGKLEVSSQPSGAP